MIFTFGFNMFEGLRVTLMFQGEMKKARKSGYVYQLGVGGEEREVGKEIVTC